MKSSDFLGFLKFKGAQKMMKKIINVFLLVFLFSGLVLPASLAEVPDIAFKLNTELSVQVGEKIDFLVLVADAEDDLAILTTTGMPTGALFEETSRNLYSFLWVPNSRQTGEHVVGFRVCDGEGCTSEDVLLEVLPNTPIVDEDVDGVADEKDSCPNTPIGEEVDTVGCTFEQNFATCTPDTKVFSAIFFNIEVSYQYEIIRTVGRQMCLVESQYISNPNPDFLGKTMACEYDSLQEFETSARDVFESFNTDNPYGNCQGELYDLFLGITRDFDSDGIMDYEDNCVEIANADQLDTDGDGIGDACEVEDPVFEDADNDGIADAEDNCPNTANADQADADADGIGDLCDTGDDPVDDELTYEEQYDDLKSEYNDFDDDYDYYKKRYNNAIDDDDEDDIEKYEDYLDELDDDLNDLDDEVEDLIDDVEAEGNVDEDLVDDLEDLEDDIEQLREKIDDLLYGGDDYDEYFYESTYVAPPKASNEPTVVIEQLDFPSVNQVNQEPVESSWDKARYVVWLIAGIVVLIAVVLFFLALLLR
jgi:hypothetical protein